jgi:hypothetical protein
MEMHLVLQKQVQSDPADVRQRRQNKPPTQPPSRLDQQLREGLAAPTCPNNKGAQMIL